MLALFLDLANLSLEIDQALVPLLERHFLVDLQELAGLALSESVVMGKRIDA